MTAQTPANYEDVRFGFGKNWLDYSKQINESRITEAMKSLERFFKPEECVGKTFLDIGCGSGLFSLAALKLGFEKVLAIDIDADSVQATTSLLSRYIPANRWDCRKISVFDLEPNLVGHFDVVYSWGVLHHTGDMKKAISLACHMVKPEGTIILALYRKTLMCHFWKWEKRLYNNGPAWFPTTARIIYKALFLAGLLLRGKNIRQYLSHYQKNRGMNWHHNVIDWLGGYPYESISPEELKQLANDLGFQVIQAFIQKQPTGLLGSGCDEFRLRKLSH